MTYAIKVTDKNGNHIGYYGKSGAIFTNNFKTGQEDLALMLQRRELNGRKFEVIEYKTSYNTVNK